MVLGFAQCLSECMERRTRSSLGIPARTLVASGFALGGAIMVATSWFVDTADDGWAWTGFAVLGAAVWTYLVRDSPRSPTRRPDADAHTGRRTDTNVNA